MRYCIYLLLQSVFSFVAEMGEELEELSPTHSVRTDSGHVLFTDRSASDQSMEAPAYAVITKRNNLDAPMYCYTMAVGKNPSRASQNVDDARDVANLLITMTRYRIYYAVEVDGKCTDFRSLYSFHSLYGLSFKLLELYIYSA